MAPRTPKIQFKLIQAFDTSLQRMHRIVFVSAFFYREVVPLVAIPFLEFIMIHSIYSGKTIDRTANISHTNFPTIHKVYEISPNVVFLSVFL